MADCDTVSHSYGGQRKHPNISEKTRDFRLTPLDRFPLQLSDVTEGGGTAFSQGGVRISPKKGSAIFWHSLYSSGDADEMTWHGSCPVIFGEKIGKSD